MKSYSAITSCLWSPKDQQEFISSSYQKYQHFRDNRIVRNPWGTNTHYYSEAEENALLSRLYKEGRLAKKLRIIYEDFKYAILHTSGKLGDYRPSKKRWGCRGNKTYWYDDHGVGYRQKMKYQKKEHHQKKELSEADVSHQEWRERKGFDIDHQKTHWWSGTRKTEAKNLSNRWNRRQEKRAIHNEDYDSFLIQKQIHDSWLWD
jgi:hypothetical protein